MRRLPQGQLGYAIDQENYDDLESGADPTLMLNAWREVKPEFNAQANPLGVAKILNQGRQGSCVGHALASVFRIVYFLQTGRVLDFSRAAAYYKSQKIAGIVGDRGSTLSAARKLATENGLCLEHHWPYPHSYNPREPADVPYDYKLEVSQPFRDVDLAWEWLESGLPIQTGVRWGNEMNRERVTSASRSGGGHSTVLWTLRGDDANNLNSWGKSWNGDGVHCWTRNAFAQMLGESWSSFIGYGPAGMQYPTPEPIA